MMAELSWWSRAGSDLLSPKRHASRSLFLDSIPELERRLLMEQCRAVDLPLRTVLYASEQSPQHAYFLTSGLASVVTSMPDGSTVEVGVMGREGVIGGLHLLGPCVISTECLMQLEGTALSISLSALRTVFRDSAVIRWRVLEFVQSHTASLGQLAACHRLHLAEERLARWLLMVQDRVKSDHLDLTQEFLGNMLGSRRTTVTKAAGVLEAAGAIESRRGHLRVVDRGRLEAAACVCYPVVSSLLDQLYSGLPGEVRAPKERGPVPLYAS